MQKGVSCKVLCAMHGKCPKSELSYLSDKCHIAEYLDKVISFFFSLLNMFKHLTETQCSHHDTLDVLSKY